MSGVVECREGIEYFEDDLDRDAHDGGDVERVPRVIERVLLMKMREKKACVVYAEHEQ